jgi:Uma2 family endonuclease
MTDVLDVLGVPEIRERVSPLSVAEYHQLGEFNENGRRTELIRGIVIEKMSKSPLHRYVANALRRLLEVQIPSDFTLFYQDPITTIDSEPEPDVLVTRGAEVDFRATHPTAAELVIEVAISSLKIDRVKALIYAEAGIKEYWIVCPKEKQVEVYRLPSAQGYAECMVLTAPVILECAALPGVRVDFGALFA